MDILNMYTLYKELWNVYIIQRVMKCIHYTKSYEMYTLYKELWNVHIIQRVMKCTYNAALWGYTVAVKAWYWVMRVEI